MVRTRPRVFSTTDISYVEGGIRIIQPRIQLIIRNLHDWDSNRQHLLDKRYNAIILPNSHEDLVDKIASIRKTRNRDLSLPNYSTPILVVGGSESDLRLNSLENVSYAPWECSCDMNDDHYEAMAGKLVRKLSKLVKVDHDYVPQPGRRTFDELRDRAEANPKYNPNDWRNKY